MAHQIAQLPINLSLKIIDLPFNLSLKIIDLCLYTFDLCLYTFMAYSMCVPQNYLLLSLRESSISFLSACHHEGLLPDPAWECKSIHFLVPLLNFPEAMTLMTWLRFLGLATWHVSQSSILIVWKKPGSRSSQMLEYSQQNWSQISEKHVISFSRS